MLQKDMLKVCGVFNEEWVGLQISLGEPREANRLVLMKSLLYPVHLRVINYSS